MASLIFTTQPVASTIYVGTDTTFTVTPSTNLVNLAGYTYQWSVSALSSLKIAGATSASLTIDPNFSDTGSVYTVSVSALSATSTGLSAALITTSAGARITVIDDPTPPYGSQDRYPESGRARHRRLRNLGYI